MTVVSQYGICNNQVCRTAEALDKRLYDLSLLRRAEVTGIKGVKLDMKLFPFFNDLFHFFGQVKERKLRILGVRGKYGGRKGTDLKAHCRKNGNDCCQGNTSYSGKVVHGYNLFYLVL